MANNIQLLAKAISKKEGFERRLVDLENEYAQVSAGGQVSDAKGRAKSLYSILVEMNQVKLSIGLAKTSESWYRQQINEEKNARKEQGQLAQG